MAPIITFNNLIVRDDVLSIDNPTTAFYLLIIFVILIFIGILSFGALMLLRMIHHRRAQREASCVEKAQTKNHRRSRHPPSISIHHNEKAAFFETVDSSGPPSPVPEIHITFPDEEGQGNKRQSGRVVVVRISETGGVGLEPYQEQLPAYQKEEGGRFQSLDLERIGGLKEKEHGP